MQNKRAWDSDLTRLVDLLKLNPVLKVAHIAKYLERTTTTVYKMIQRLRKDGRLPHPNQHPYVKKRKVSER